MSGRNAPALRRRQERLGHRLLATRYLFTQFYKAFERYLP